MDANDDKSVRFQRGKARLRELAISQLVVNPSMRAAAKECGVSYRTLVRWSNEPQFAAELQAARNEIRNGAIQRLKASAFDAVGTLMEIAANPQCSDMARVSSAKSLIELSLRVSAIEQLEARIAE